MSNINLLPKNIKDDISQAKKNKVTFSYFMKSIFLLIIIILIAGGTFFYFTLQSSSINETIKTESKRIDEYSNLENGARLIAERLSTISKIEKNLNYWSDTLEEIQVVMPSGAFLSSMNISSDDKNRGKIAGFADSKDTVATLRNTMESSSKFEYVDIDSSNLAYNPDLEKDVENFIISFSLTKEALDEQN